MQPYGCKAYALIHHIPRKSKVDPRAFIGYLVGYDSTNIFRIWVPSRKRVLRTRDVTFNWQQFYNPRDLDISAILKDYVDIDQLIETLDLPEYQPQDQQEEDDVLDTIVVEVPAAPEPAPICWRRSG